MISVCKRVSAFCINRDNGLQPKPFIIQILLSKVLSLYQTKTFADDKINVTQKLKLVSERTENIFGERENGGNQYFRLFPQYFLT